mmetsp:Transcript_30655/g.98785  ORF Transcript_30655/g.98785 Transcript_30655/m.98785 type:complete len:260 (+) Transcript_30655:107-886(+)
MAAEATVVGVVSKDAVVAPQLSLAERVRRMQDELDISEDMVQDLLKVAGCDIYVVADDSGSMNCVAGGRETRWDELRGTLQRLAKMLLVVDHSDGFSLKFLNDATVYTVKVADDVDAAFRGRQPRGATPLLANCAPVLDGTFHPKETDVLLLVFTDGVPSDGTFTDLQQAVQAKRPHVFVGFMMCTDEDDVVDNYNTWLDKIPGVDVNDDYYSEKKEAEQRGNTLSYYKWLAKAVLGPKLTKYDKLDDPIARKACCVLQ